MHGLRSVLTITADVALLIHELEVAVANRDGIGEHSKSVERPWRAVGRADGV